MPPRMSQSRKKLMPKALLLHANGWGNEEIGRHLGVSGGTIDRWLTVETYCQLRQAIFGEERVPPRTTREGQERKERVDHYCKLAEEELPLVYGAAS